ncbi:helix-turn-helix transcriptional regulator [Mesorhizobium sp. CAU 1732]|uniref:helix-turn-helix transcriptional regulator n=1 Tax=Mesorhizobium sp. CAU 1732 TaxID=3140358 RepID=UPI00326010E3
MNNIASFESNLRLYSAGAERSEEEFIRIVGERVRMARARKGLSRKALSESSEVSQRYLAQLEGGEGNISIALLKRIALALDHRIEWLVGEDDPWSSDVVRIASLFRVATQEQKRRVLGILDPENASLQRVRRIALIGLRGAGKSTLGRLASASLSVPFTELNAEIEASSGMPVNELMALYGQEGYRRLERQSLERVAASQDAMVLAVAGGIVSEPDTFNYLVRNFHTIWLKASPQEHMNRVRKQGDTRPMAGNPAAMDELKTILTSRESLYARSEAQVDTSGKSIEESLALLLETIEREGFLRR